MEYKIELIKKEAQKTSLWSGGTTTELCISPRSAEYSKRNFNWRLSSAVVELEESTFTSLPGVDRHIMIIEGEMDLRHEGHYNLHLSPYQKDFFKGDWVTNSKGRVRDFNLMLANGYKGNIDSIRILDEIIYLCEGNDFLKGKTYAFYCTEGQVEFCVDRHNFFTVKKGDILFIQEVEEQKDITIRNCYGDASILIIAEIYN